ncbi:NB-ARC domain-containing protein [Streptomyces sp. NPDC059680]|uniref:NB-ARC domain-containing protein n=1 Tax=Streptomyces sp. NPDC059680 TaxID=3346904 RepID=UPI0036A1029B
MSPASSPPYVVQASHHGMAVGHADQVSYYANHRSPASWPLQLGVIPAAARCFQPRPALDERTNADAASTAVRCTVLVGTAGVGKTQQAARFARAAWQEKRVDLLLWVAGTDREAVVAAYAHAIADITGADPAGGSGTAAAEQAAQAFLAWLRPDAGGPRRRWLIVLDDVADPEDLRGLWPPQNQDGEVLVTTRRRDVAQPAPNRAVVPVGGFTPDEATTYLSEALAAYGRDPGPASDLDALARELGFLPLALAQVAAGLAGSGQDCGTYLGLLREYDLLDGADDSSGARRGRPLSGLLPGPGALPDGQGFAVTEAWRSLLDRADRLPPTELARPLMEVASLLPAAGAPASVFTNQACADYVQQQRATPSPGQFLRGEDITAALGVLDRLGLIDYEPRGSGDPYRAVRVHPVLQRAVREGLPADRIRGLARTVASAWVKAADAHGADPAFVPVFANAADVLRAHAAPALWSPFTPPAPGTLGVSLNELFEDPHPDTHELLFRTGELLGTTGRSATGARDHFAWLAGEVLRRQGPESPSLEAACARQAHWQGVSGDAHGAAAGYAAIVDRQSRVFGPHHARTFAARAALGHWREAAGDTAGAVAAYAELLPLQQRSFGADSSYALETAAELARVQGESGDAYGAAITYETLLNDLLRTLRGTGGLQPRSGPYGNEALVRSNWLKVFTAHRGHAHWRGRAGDAAGAAVSFTYLLNEQVRVLGPDHPDVLATREELAHWEEHSRTR